MQDFLADKEMSRGECLWKTGNGSNPFLLHSKVLVCRLAPLVGQGLPLQSGSRPGWEPSLGVKGCTDFADPVRKGQLQGREIVRKRPEVASAARTCQHKLRKELGQRGQTFLAQSPHAVVTLNALLS